MNIIINNIFAISIIIAIAIGLILLLPKRQKKVNISPSIGFIRPKINIIALNNAVNMINKENLDKDISYNFLFEFQDNKNKITHKIMSIPMAKKIYRTLKERYSCFNSGQMVEWDYILLSGKRRLSFIEFIDHFKIILQGDE